jgi:O-antigen/teichoic acid export membrane protein
MSRFSRHPFTARLLNLDFSYLYALLSEVTLGFTFLFYVIIARVLGPESYGVFSAAVALGGILGVIIQYGLPTLLNRDVASDPEQGPGHTATYLLIQVLNTLPVLAVLPVFIHLMGFTKEGVLLCWLAIAAEFFRSTKMLWRAVLKGQGWFNVEALSVTVERLGLLVCGTLVLLITRNPAWVFVAIVLTRLVDNLAVGNWIHRRVRLRTPGAPLHLKQSYRRGFPFAVHGIFWVLYYQVDMVMLKVMSPAAEVGYYGAAYRVMEIFSALPRVVFYVAFTRFAQSLAQHPHLLPKKVMEACRVLMCLVLPPLVIAGFTQPWIMQAIFGLEYLPSLTLLAILLPSLGINMFSSLYEGYLLATHREKLMIPLLMVVAVSNIGINYLLIPRFGAAGAAWATLISEALLCILGMLFIFKNDLRAIRFTLIQFLVLSFLIGSVPSLLFLGVSFPIALAITLALGCLLFSIVRRNPPNTV